MVEDKVGITTGSVMTGNHCIHKMILHQHIGAVVGGGEL